jgi:predicted RNA-binding Zn-ribbon protein involved in translation (DUF1610 family)
MSEGLCTSCGAEISLTDGKDEINCAYCGTLAWRPEAETKYNEVMSGSIGDKLQLAEKSFRNGESSEIAFRLYDQAIEEDENAVEAWFGRGFCLVNGLFGHCEGGLQFGYKTAEGISSLESAIRLATNPESARRRAGIVIAERVAKFNKKPFWHFPNPIEVTHCDTLLVWALDKYPQSEFLLKTGVEFYMWARKKAWEEIKDSIGMISEESQIRRRSIKTLLDTSLTPNLQKYLPAIAVMDPVYMKEVIERLRLLGEEMKDVRQDIVKKSGCFIATACYGNYDHPVVMELRYFRDNCLETSTVGQAFVRWYYQWSPTFASLLAKNRMLKALARGMIVVPVVLIARLIRGKS